MKALKQEMSAAEGSPAAVSGNSDIAAKVTEQGNLVRKLKQEKADKEKVGFYHLSKYFTIFSLLYRFSVHLRHEPKSLS